MCAMPVKPTISFENFESEAAEAINTLALRIFVSSSASSMPFFMVATTGFKASSGISLNSLSKPS